MDIRELLPNQNCEIERVQTDTDSNEIQLSLRSLARSARCPCCEMSTCRIHSQYVRKVRDVSWGDRPVRITLKVHRFFCDNPECERRIFTERLPGLVAPYAQRTERLARLMQGIGLFCGGTMGVTILRQLPVITSRWTVLREVRRASVGRDYTPRVLGVDDWAIRRGHRYGTILVDLELRQVIDLLPDREADTLANWLKAHPGIEVVSRDRAGAYAQAAQRGAPHAIQVADRWHILKNLGDALTNLFGRHRRLLQQLKSTPHTGNHQNNPLSPSEAYQKRQYRFERVRQLRQDGLTISAIASVVNLDRKTIRKYLNSDHCPGDFRRRSFTRVNKLSPYHDYLLHYGLDGQRTVRQLWRDLQDQGYTGSLSVVAAFVAAARQGLLPTSPAVFPIPTAKPDKLTPRCATWLILARDTDLTADQRQQAQQLSQLHPEITVMVTEAQAFATIIRQRTVETFDGWLQRTRQSAIRELRTFARGIQRDYDAVRASLELPWSNGIVEGNVKRLKFIKRSMFGRAKFDLLRLRVLARTSPPLHQTCT